MRVICILIAVFTTVQIDNSIAKDSKECFGQCDIPISLHFYYSGLREGFVWKRKFGREQVRIISEDKKIHFTIHDCTGTTDFVEYAPEGIRVQGRLFGDTLCDTCHNWAQLEKGATMKCHRPYLNDTVFVYQYGSLIRKDVWEKGVLINEVPSADSTEKYDK